MWERDGGEPNIHGKGKVSRQLREVASRLLWEAQDGTCSICGDAMLWPHFARDHVNPFSLSRDDSIWNTRLAHSECDKKRGRTPYNADQRARFAESEAKLEMLLTLVARPRTLRGAGIS